MFGKKNIEVNAILDKELEALLFETDQFEALLQGELKCVSCETTITTDNIGIIVPINSGKDLKAEFYCERIDCAEKYKHAAE